MQLHQRIVAPAPETHGDDAIPKLIVLDALLKALLTTGYTIVQAGSSKTKARSASSCANKDSCSRQNTNSCRFTKHSGDACRSSCQSYTICSSLSTDAVSSCASCSGCAQARLAADGTNQPVISPVQTWADPRLYQLLLRSRHHHLRHHLGLPRMLLLHRQRLKLILVLAPLLVPRRKTLTSIWNSASTLNLQTRLPSRHPKVLLACALASQRRSRRC